MVNLEIPAREVNCKNVGQGRSYGGSHPLVFSNLLHITRLFRGGFCSRRHAEQYRGQRELEFISVRAAQGLQMDVDGPARSTKVRVALAQGLHLRRLQQSVYCLHVKGRQQRELRRGHDDLHQLVSDGHSHPVPDPCRGRRADPVLFHPEEDLGSYVRVGPVAFQLPDLDRPHQPVGLVGPTRSLRGTLY